MTRTGREASRGTSRPVRWIAAVIAVLLVPLLAAPPAGADAVGESDRAVELAQQAIAYLVNDPDNLMVAQEKVGDALEAPDQRGVDQASLERAMAALRDKDAHEARAELERAIGARPHLGTVEPLPIREIGARPVTGAESGTLVVTDPMPGRGALTGASWVVVAGSVLVALGGAFAAWRFRPPRHPVGAGSSEEGR